MWSWGKNTSGELGINDQVSHSSPVLVFGSHVFSDLSGGEISAYGIDSEGAGWGWGNNGKGELGTGNTTIVWTPTAIVGSHVFLK